MDTDVKETLQDVFRTKLAEKGYTNPTVIDQISTDSVRHVEKFGETVETALANCLMVAQVWPEKWYCPSCRKGQSQCREVHRYRLCWQCGEPLVRA